MSEARPWLDSYPDGVPREIDPSVHDSVVDIFDEAAKRFAERPAFKNFGVEMDFATLDRRVRAFASWLVHDVGLERGERVAIMMPNLLQYPVATFGALRAGCAVVNTNPLYTERELEHQLKDSGASVVVVAEPFAHVVQKVVAKVPVKRVVLVRFGDLLGFPKGMIVNLVVKRVKKLVPAYSLPDAVGFNDVLKRGEALPDARATLGHDDLAFLQYTGGTTGVAKGAMLTHGNMVANVLQAGAWLEPLQNRPGHETIVTALPLYHIFALTANCLVHMRIGAMNLLITNPRDIPAFVKDMAATPFSAITGVNTLFNALLENEEFRGLDFSRMKLTLGGGTAVQEVVARRWKEVTGSTLIEAYGLTETSPAVCINPALDDAWRGGIGLPISSTEVRTVGEDGADAPAGEPGELCVRGPQVMKGYWRRPDETDKTLDAEGWLHTGDVAVMDEAGFVRIVDRLKDMILVSGFNVYPNEIEGVVAEMPQVLECGAIGVPDERAGEAVKLVVVKRDESLTEADVKAWCKERLTGYKRPKIVQFVAELPKTNVGKVLRRELRDL